jgi:hypothetical protein
VSAACESCARKAAVSQDDHSCVSTRGVWQREIERADDVDINLVGNLAHRGNLWTIECDWPIRI